MAKELISFYSRADENYVNGTVQTLTIGNTERVAKMIHELTGADLFKIEQLHPYAKRYNDCINEAQNDQRQNARPALAALPKDFETYSVIYLGYPNYWSTMPMAVFTFLESLDCSGKTIVPFYTHEGSGLGKSAEDIRRLCPNSTVEEGLAIRGCCAARAKEAVQKWLGTSCDIRTRFLK